MAITFRAQLNDAGVSPLPGSIGPIVPIVLREPQAALAVAEQLLKDGFLVGAIRPPTVPRGTSRLRVTLHANASDSVVSLLASRIAAAIPRSLRV